MDVLKKGVYVGGVRRQLKPRQIVIPHLHALNVAGLLALIIHFIPADRDDIEVPLLKLAADCGEHFDMPALLLLSLIVRSEPRIGLTQSVEMLVLDLLAAIHKLQSTEHF